jgi:predicted kinase
VFIVLAGLPGTGKSTLARALAAELDAVWLRVDSIEQALCASGAVDNDLKDIGYRAAYAVADTAGRSVEACVGLVRAVL